MDEEHNIYEVIRRRRDVRAEFTGELVDDDTLMRLLDAAHCAPSVGNSQPWDFVIVRDPGTLSRFATHVAEKRKEFHASLPPERARTFDPIKIEGIAEGRRSWAAPRSRRRACTPRSSRSRTCGWPRPPRASASAG
jgi:5,6-dimethylbenzimidazole synthase